MKRCIGAFALLMCGLTQGAAAFPIEYAPDRAKELAPAVLECREDRFWFMLVEDKVRMARAEAGGEKLIDAERRTAELRADGGIPTSLSWSGPSSALEFQAPRKFWRC